MCSGGSRSITCFPKTGNVFRTSVTWVPKLLTMDRPNNAMDSVCFNLRNEVRPWIQAIDKYSFNNLTLCKNANNSSFSTSNFTVVRILLQYYFKQI